MRALFFFFSFLLSENNGNIAKPKDIFSRNRDQFNVSQAFTPVGIAQTSFACMGGRNFPGFLLKITRAAVGISLYWAVRARRKLSLPKIETKQPRSNITGEPRLFEQLTVSESFPREKDQLLRRNSIVLCRLGGEESTHPLRDTLMFGNDVWTRGLFLVDFLTEC